MLVSWSFAIAEVPFRRESILSEWYIRHFTDVLGLAIESKAMKSMLIGVNADF